MFDKLKRKYTLWLLLPVTVVLVLYGLVVFLFYSNLLEDDYDSKICYFGEQQVSNAEQILKHIELNMKMFLLEQDFSADDMYAQYKISDGIKKFKSVNMDISSIYFVDSLSDHTLLLNEYGQVKDNDFLLTQYHDLFRNPPGEIQWYYLKYTDSAKDALLCLQSVAAGNEEDSYTIGIVISTSRMLPMIVDNLEDSGIFSDFILDANILPDSDVVLFMDGKDVEYFDSFHDAERRKSENYFTERIGSYPFTFYLQYSKESLNEMQLSFFVGMIVICIVIFVAAYIIQKLFINRTTMALQDMSDRFSQFIDNFDDYSM